MTWLHWVVAAAVFVAGSAPAYAANTELGRIGGNFVVVTVVVLLLAGLARRVPILTSKSAAPAPAAPCASSSARR